MGWHRFVARQTCDPVLFDRFKREEKVGRELNHSGVMKVFENEDPFHVYMVMEWIEGRLLRRLLDEEKRLPTERAVRPTIEICEALDYIHSQGVVHRDLKPGTELNSSISEPQVTRERGA